MFQNNCRVALTISEFLIQKDELRRVSLRLGSLVNWRFHNHLQDNLTHLVIWKKSIFLITIFKKKHEAACLQNHNNIDCLKCENMMISHLRATRQRKIKWVEYKSKKCNNKFIICNYYKLSYNTTALLFNATHRLMQGTNSIKRFQTQILPIRNNGGVGRR